MSSRLLRIGLGGTPSVPRITDNFRPARGVDVEQNVLPFLEGQRNPDAF